MIVIMASLMMVIIITIAMINEAQHRANDDLDKLPHPCVTGR